MSICDGPPFMKRKITRFARGDGMRRTDGERTRLGSGSGRLRAAHPKAHDGAEGAERSHVPTVQARFHGEVNARSV